MESIAYFAWLAGFSGDFFQASKIRSLYCDNFKPGRSSFIIGSCRS
jgi:hypothetical protein